jgi:hypothetical protein
MKDYRYDPKKIVAEFARLNSMRRSERILKNNCLRLEQQISENKQVLSLLQRIQSMVVGIEKLLPFCLAVNEKARTRNLSVSTAANCVIEGIEHYNKIDGLKKEISRLAVQIYVMNEICAPRNKAITFLLNLQNYRIMDDEIINLCEYLNRARFESVPFQHTL